VTTQIGPHNIDASNQAIGRALIAALADLAERGRTLEAFAITASQGWFNWRLMWAALSHIPAGAAMFNGMANGGDCLARSFWWAQGSPVRPFWADWGMGRHAGMVRNELMLEHMPQLVVAFLRLDLRSSGTRNTIEQAHHRGIPVFVFHQLVQGERSEQTDPRHPDRR
jgi:hypothetical protein